MTMIKLEVPCSKSFHGISPDPNPDWNLDSLISELNALEIKLKDSAPTNLKKTKPLEFSNAKYNYTMSEGFVMRVLDDEMEHIDDNDEGGYDQSLMTGRRFSCPDLDLSDIEDSEDELDHETIETHLMEKTGLEEGILFELEHECQLRVKEEIRNRFSALEEDLANENERSYSALIQVEKYMDAKREMDRRLDKQYQRKIAEALDNHLSAVQRDHEQISLIEERRIRNDAAFEEARRKEIALHEEKMRQEKAKEEAEARLKAVKVAEEAQKAALEAKRKGVKEAAEREATETTKVVAMGVTQNGVIQCKEDTNGQLKGSGSHAPSVVQSAVSTVKAAESALRAEREILGRYKQLAEINRGFSSNKGFLSYERQIGRKLRQISGGQDNIRARASDLVKIINDPHCPQSMSIAMFAKQVPTAMDIVLAEFHKACIYTVPKHINYSESAFKSEEAYYKAVGYQEGGGKIEPTDSYLERVRSYMTLYAAIVQTEIPGIRNLHGLKEAWAWLARFLNALPANLYTAVALLSFLKISGYTLLQKYKSQFRKILNVISGEFLFSLKALGDPKLNKVIAEIETYFDTEQFLQEPEGLRPQSYLLSKHY
ncbi:nucleoporin GLE1-like protein isoform X2 [Tasmannia lanceolata]|uniref:nucleoporin GLE1-like protein isoform X2 n=1 Tax=Tasmannia lanceolata TaxID=3420 RepID=UPI004062E123